MSVRRTRALLSGGSRLCGAATPCCLINASKMNPANGLSKNSSRSLATLVGRQRLHRLLLSSTKHGTGRSRESHVQVGRRWNTTLSESIEPPRPSSVYDKSENWEDWFPKEEYDNPWVGLTPVDNPQLDKATRSLIQQLQDCYHGLVLGKDRPTTAQCNRVLKDILSETLQEATHRAARNRYAHRADALLQCMELFRNLDPKDSSVKLPYHLPHPSFETYQTVLTLYGRTDGLSAEEGPDRCQAVVKRMERQLLELGDLNLTPSSFAWNQVLLAWATCKDPEKAFSAANLLQRLKRDGLSDDYSYSHVIKACAFSGKEGRSRNLGSQVAVKVWHEMVSKDILCTSRTYHFYLTACSFLRNASQRHHEVEAAFTKCCDEGKVSNHVLQSMRQAASPSFQKKLLRDQYGVDTASSLPPAWTRNAVD